MRTEYCKNFPRDDWDFTYEGEEGNTPYSIIVEFNTWAGNFDRELIGYSMGMLDEVQMNEVAHSEEERAMFWKEVFNRDLPIEYDDEYTLKDKYLYERWEDVDDWMQATFYNVFGYEKFVSEDSTSCLKIYLFDQIKPEWFEQVIINRMYDFFTKKIYKWKHKDDRITALYLVDKDNNVIKHYTYSDVNISKEELSCFYKAEERTMTKAQEAEEKILEEIRETTKLLEKYNEILKEIRDKHDS